MPDLSRAPACPKRAFATQADRLRPRLKGGWLPSAVDAPRLLSSLGDMPPVEYEEQYYQA